MQSDHKGRIWLAALGGINAVALIAVCLNISAWRISFSVLLLSVMSVIVKLFWKKQINRRTAELRASEARLCLAQRVAQFGNWEWNLQTNVVYWSDEMFRILDLPMQPPTIEAIGEAIHPDDRDMVWRVSDAAIQAHKPFNLDFRVIGSSGIVHYIHDQGEVSYDDAGQPLVMFGTMQDITARKQAEETLREREKMLNMIFENSPIALETYDRQGILTTCNRRVSEMFAMDATSQIGKFNLHNDPNYQYRDVWEKLERGEEVRHEIVFDFDKVPYATAKRGIAYFDIITTPIPEHISNRIGYIMQIIDITERKQAEEKLRLSEASLKLTNAQLNQAQHIASIGSWTHNPDNAMPEWSDEMFRIFGIDPLNGVPTYPEFRGLIQPDQHARLDDAVNALLTTGQGYSLELGITRPDGCERIIHLQSLTIAGEQDQPSYILGTAQDITERKQTEEKIRRLNAELEQRVCDRTAKLEAANKELEAFSYSVSHDLRAPLRHIAGFVEMLDKRAPQALDDKSKHYLQVISDAAQQMGKLIDDLLSFSRMGRAEMVKSRVNMAQVCQEAISLAAEDAAGREIVWSVAPLPDMVGDPAMLKLVMVNLLSNAVKFTKTRPQAMIEIGYLPDNTAEEVFYVKDNGVGFDMKYVDKLFGLFQRLHRVEEFEGTGLGLANVRRIIQRHGGRIWAESAVDHGATFSCALPKVTAS